MEDTKKLSIWRHLENKMDKVREYFDNKANQWDSFCTKSQEELKDILKDVIVHEGDKVLDLACGTGVITNILYEKAKKDIYAVDISPNMINIAKEKYKDLPIHFSAIDFLDYEEKDFDVIVLFDAYPHFLDFPSFKNKVCSSLKTGGLFYIIHDCSRDELNHHHMTFAKEVSRGLIPVEKEALQFKDQFDVVKAKEDNRTYRIYLRKK